MVPNQVNRIGDGGACALSEALKVNTTLVSLDLRCVQQQIKANFSSVNSKDETDNIFVSYLFRLGGRSQRARGPKDKFYRGQGVDEMTETLQSVTSLTKLLW